MIYNLISYSMVNSVVTEEGEVMVEVVDMAEGVVTVAVEATVVGEAMDEVVEEAVDKKVTIHQTGKQTLMLKNSASCSWVAFLQKLQKIQ